SRSLRGRVDPGPHPPRRARQRRPTLQSPRRRLAVRTSIQYYMHDEPDAFRLELSGALAGDGAQDVYHAWKTALSIVGARPFIVDLSYVSGIDDYGRALVQLW